MKVIYRNCEIDCTREKALSGDVMLFYSVFDLGVYDKDFEITSGFSEGEDTVREYVRHLKQVVDDYIENPDMYTDVYN
jgi:hypothetical protein